MVINLGMHVVLSTFDFYPMFGREGRLLTQEQAREVYGPTPVPLAAATGV